MKLFGNTGNKGHARPPISRTSVSDAGAAATGTATVPRNTASRGSAVRREEQPVRERMPATSRETPARGRMPAAREDRRREPAAVGADSRRSHGMAGEPAWLADLPPAGQRSRKRRGSWKRALAAAFLIVIALAAGGGAAGVFYLQNLDTVFPNVTVDGIAIGGLTLQETTEKLIAKGYGDVGQGAVTVVLPENREVTVTARDACTVTPAREIAMRAWSSCRSDSPLDNALRYLRCSSAGLDLQSGAQRYVDAGVVRTAVEDAVKDVQRSLLDSEQSIGEDAIRVFKGAKGVQVDTEGIVHQVVDALQNENYTTLSCEAEIEANTELDLESLYQAIYIPVEDARYSSADNEIYPEVTGVSFDMEEARRLWDAAGYGDEVVIPLVRTEPSVTTASLQAMLFRDKLSEKTTSLWGSTIGRINNIVKAAGSINDVVVLPGAQFDYNTALGQRTAANGYELAGAYSGGQTVQEYGGGICQVSSTLYYCCLYANLAITSRTCHMFPVSYLPAGLDATVSWGGPEYRFINDRDYPIRINAWVDDSRSNVTVQIWGTDVDGSYVEMTSDVSDGGYRAQTYRNVYDSSGTLVSRTAEAYSVYYRHSDFETPQVTTAPAKTPAPTAAPAETTAPTAVPTETAPQQEPEVTYPPEQEPSAEPEIPVEQEPEPQPEVPAEQEPEPQPEVPAEQEPEPQPEVPAEQEPEPQPEVPAEQEPEPQPEVPAGQEPQPQPEVPAEQEPEPQPEVPPQEEFSTASAPEEVPAISAPETPIGDNAGVAAEADSPPEAFTEENMG